MTMTKAECMIMRLARESPKVATLSIVGLAEGTVASGSLAVNRYQESAGERERDFYCEV